MWFECELPGSKPQAMTVTANTPLPSGTIIASPLTELVEPDGDRRVTDV